MNIENNNGLSNQLNVFDLQSLRRQTHSTVSKDVSLEQAAKQFEGIFLRQLLTSMRKVNDLFKKDNVFDSKTSDFYQGMWDDQISSSLSNSNNATSISSLMIKQLGSAPQKSFSQFKLPSKTLAVTHPNPAVIKASARLDGSINQLDKAEKSSQPTTTEPLFFATKQQFLDVLYPKAKLAAEKIGGSAKALLAQIALETGWGKNIIQKDKTTSSKNLFNIKQKQNWTGEVTQKKTVEFDGQQFNLEQASFRVYQDFTQSFEDFVNFISSKQRYQSVIDHAADPKQYFKQLQQSGYATDPEYATKIEKIFNSEYIQNLGK